MPFAIEEHVLRTDRHTTGYMACGAEQAPLLIFVHGWPELSWSWRHQLPVFAALGFRCIAPDMRGYGRSSVYDTHDAYALQNSARDMLELLDALGAEKAVWIGHDWGAPVVWGIASHYPDRCHAVANLCVPYFAKGFGPGGILSLIDRDLYPAEKFPAGQWEYQLFYRENFARAQAVFEADVQATVKALFRKGSEKAIGKASRTALVRIEGGWFGGADKAPDVPMDTDVLTEADCATYTESLTRNGFFGPNSWYMNHEANAAWSAAAVNGGRLTMPVLFLHGAYDTTCDTMHSRLADPMRADCADLTEHVVQSGHWMAQEQPIAVNAALARWLATKLPHVWAA